MRRKDKEITDISEMLGILHDAHYCTLSFSQGNEPYSIPMNFGYYYDEHVTLYFHSASEGHKIDILKSNPHVFINCVVDAAVRTNANPCEWGMRYASVSGSGKAEIITEHTEKIIALQHIMKQYSGKNDHVFDDSSVAKIIVFKVVLTSITGKTGG